MLTPLYSSFICGGRQGVIITASNITFKTHCFCFWSIKEICSHYFLMHLFSNLLIFTKKCKADPRQKKKKKIYWRSNQNYPIWVNLSALFLILQPENIKAYILFVSLGKTWTRVYKEIIIFTSRVLSVLWSSRDG